MRAKCQPGAFGKAMSAKCQPRIRLQTPKRQATTERAKYAPREIHSGKTTAEKCHPPVGVCASPVNGAQTHNEKL